MVETSYERPWQNTLPTPYGVPFWKYNPSPAFGQDELGNNSGTFDDVVLQPVQGWDSHTTEAPGDVTSERFDVMLRAPTDFWPKINDRIGLPIPDNDMVLPGTMFNPDGSVSIGVFEVVGHIMEGDAFHRWRLTNLILLKRLSG